MSYESGSVIVNVGVSNVMNCGLLLLFCEKVEGFSIALCGDEVCF